MQTQVECTEFENISRGRRTWIQDFLQNCYLNCNIRFDEQFWLNEHQLEWSLLYVWNILKVHLPIESWCECCKWRSTTKCCIPLCQMWTWIFKCSCSQKSIYLWKKALSVHIASSLFEDDVFHQISALLGSSCSTITMTMPKKMDVQTPRAFQYKYPWIVLFDSPLFIICFLIFLFVYIKYWTFAHVLFKIFSSFYFVLLFLLLFFVRIHIRMGPIQSAAWHPQMFMCQIRYGVRRTSSFLFYSFNRIYTDYTRMCHVYMCIISYWLYICGWMALRQCAPSMEMPSHTPIWLIISNVYVRPVCVCACSMLSGASSHIAPCACVHISIWRLCTVMMDT